MTDWQPPRPFVYTPLHGVGGLVLPNVCNSIGIHDFVSVTAQEKPDPDFPTVKFPNPEESGALNLAIQTADQEEKTLIIANDPDADRFAVAEKVGYVNLTSPPYSSLMCFHLDSETWYTMSGNHVGVLLASHILDSYDSGNDCSNLAVLTTTVSSSMLAKMAAAKGIQFTETLTGFKWMANVARDLEKEGKTVVFSYEEALGYMFPSVCYDKDGITAATVFLAAEAKWRAQGLTAYGKLQKLFTEFGHHETLNNYFRSPDPQLTSTLFQGIRGSSCLAEMKFGPFKILRWRDLTEGYDSSTPDKKPDLPEDPSSQMLTLWLDGGVRFTFRGSGTEPKVKCMISQSKYHELLTDILHSLYRELWRVSRGCGDGGVRCIPGHSRALGSALYAFDDIQQTASYFVGSCLGFGISNDVDHRNIRMDNTKACLSSPLTPDNNKPR